MTTITAFTVADSLTPTMSSAVTAMVMMTAGRLKTATVVAMPPPASWTTVPGAALIAAGKDDPELVEQRDEVARPADRHRRRPERVFEDQVPADDPGDELAERGVGVGVSGPGDRHAWRRTPSSTEPASTLVSPAMTIEMTMAGPALAAAACPVRTKMPVPMIAPTPSMTSWVGSEDAFQAAFSLAELLDLDLLDRLGRKN